MTVFMPLYSVATGGAVYPFSTHNAAIRNWCFPVKTAAINHPRPTNTKAIPRDGDAGLSCCSRLCILKSSTN